ncbi:GL17946 [Drosophila persimilis]|uniref:GL17946 n=1 Tax=Drosophila persimilis TaxID=7234 RepID=B4H1T5_DROPE|nr:mediator of RNA polymerase II transcription subunit 13 [Drosophila persimilis]EDW30287.1 GL17946 [Drosophila persimilis]
MGKILLLLLALELSHGIKVETIPVLREVLVPSNNTSSPPVYRVSKPEPKQPEKRVPSHLQDIVRHPGYVDDDAGDVIRIIEPPQHFQQLKRLRQRQPLGPAVVWEQPRKLSTNRTPPQPQPQLQPRPGDLLTQETQNMPLAGNSNSNNLQLPMEILASVRKTERLLHRQRQKLPLVRQRHIQRQSHTLIAQKSLEQQLYQRGQQQRLRAVLSRNQQEHKRQKRMKRETNTRSKADGAYGVQQGLKLVAHIGDLLRNATLYLPDDEGQAKPEPEAPNEVKKSPACNGNATTSCDSRRRRQRLFKPPKAVERQRERLRERRRNFRNEATSTTTTTTTTAQPPTTTTTQVIPTTKTTGKSVAAAAVAAAALSGTATSTTSATPLASRLRNSRKSPNNNRNDGGSVARSDDSILYADIMTNIRHLWQEQDLLGAAPPQFIAPHEVQNNTDYRALDVYLKDLDELSKRLPTVAPITGLNREELEWATPTPSWYLINQEGKIYETRLDSETKPSSTLFHRFPDMPKADGSVSTLDLE